MPTIDPGEVAALAKARLGEIRQQVKNNPAPIVVMSWEDVAIWQRLGEGLYAYRDLSAQQVSEREDGYLMSQAEWHKVDCRRAIRRIQLERVYADY